MNTNLITVTQYDEIRNQIDEVKDTCNFIPDVSTDEGYDKSKRISLDVGQLLTSLEKKRKELKSDSLAFGRKVDAEAFSIKDELIKFQRPHKDAYKELDNSKKEREANRKAKLELRVQEVRELPETMKDSDSEGCKMALESLISNECLDFYEYTEQALKARNASKKALSKMFSEKIKYEQEQKELDELRKKQAEQEQKDRDERIAKEASAKAEEETRLAKEAEQRAIDQAAEAVQQREAAEAKAKLDTKEAEEKAKRDAEAAAEKAKQAQIAEQKANEDIVAEDRRKREADKKHIGRTRKAAKEGFMALGFSQEEAKELVMDIHNAKIENVFIRY